MGLESVKYVKMGERVVKEEETSVQRPCGRKETITLWSALQQMHLGDLDSPWEEFWVFVPKVKKAINCVK